MGSSNLGVESTIEERKVFKGRWKRYMSVGSLIWGFGSVVRVGVSSVEGRGAFRVVGIGSSGTEDRT